MVLLLRSGVVGGGGRGWGTVEGGPSLPLVAQQGCLQGGGQAATARAAANLLFGGLPHFKHVFKIKARIERKTTVRTW
jgi:hypothetical protein